MAFQFAIGVEPERLETGEPLPLTSAADYLEEIRQGGRNLLSAGSYPRSTYDFVRAIAS